MNKTRILALASAIESGALAAQDIGFNMVDYRPSRTNRHISDHTGKNCGTVCCIGGWAVFLFSELTESESVSTQAARLLGLEDLEKSEKEDSLFTPMYLRNYHEITAAHAVAVLKHLAETGEVQWNKFAELSPGVITINQEGTEE